LTHPHIKTPKSPTLKILKITMWHCRRQGLAEVHQPRVVPQRLRELAPDVAGGEAHGRGTAAIRGGLGGDNVGI